MLYFLRKVKEMPRPEERSELNKKLGQVAAPGLGLCIILSLLVHLFVLGTIVYEFPSKVLTSLGFEEPAPEPAAAAQNREEIVMVQLLGNTSGATDDSPEVAREAPAPPPPPEPEAPAVPEPEAPAAQALPALDDAIPLGPVEARPEPPELTKTNAAPPEVTPPPVSPPREPQPPRRQPPRPEPPKQQAQKRPQKQTSDYYQRTMGTLGRDANLTLGAISGSVSDPVIRSYYNNILRRFKANWRPASANKQADLRAYFSITIEVDGRISGIRLTRSSGDAAFDRSAGEAIRKSSPLPPLPAIFAGRRDRPEFVFTSRD